MANFWLFGSAFDQHKIAKAQTISSLNEDSNYFHKV